MTSSRDNAPKIDLESYISNYAGRARLDRLISVAYSNSHLAPEALRLAVVQARKSINAEEYAQLAKDLKAVSPNDPLAEVDGEWMSTITRRVGAETIRLESELKQYKNNLIKESIRMGNEDLGNHYLAIGDPTNAHKSYSRMRENCTTAKHIVEMNLKLLNLAIIQRNWPVAASFTIKMSAVIIRGEERTTKIDPIVNAATGLASMNQGHYRDAADLFLAVNPSYMTLPRQAGIQFQIEVLSPNDIAIYGGLCALASMDSHELQTKVLDNQPFRKFLELEPHLRRAISMFCSSKFSSCLAVLESYAGDYLLDLYLQEHFKPLYQMVRTKSLVKWLSAFSVVTFKEIESAFPIPHHMFPKTKQEDDLVSELVGLIQNGSLQARIDLVDQVLVSPTADPRLAVIEQTMEMSKAQEKTLRLRLNRINMLISGLEVRAPKVNPSQFTSTFGEPMGPDGGPLSRGGRRKDTHGAGGVMV